MSKLERMFNRTEEKKEETHPRWETRWIHYTKLEDNTEQYCEGYEKDVYTDEVRALAALIETDGEVLQNLLVRRIDADRYEILGGHKRRLACRYLVEEEGKKQYEFLPCKVQHVSEIRAKFQVYSSNGYHDMTEYERMHELEQMKYLLETYPEEFPHLQTGRMVERLARQKNMKRTTVGEYLTISKNLSERGRKEFAQGTLKKSAALEISGLPEKEQEELLDKGVTLQKDIRAYKQRKEVSRQKEEKTADAPQGAKVQPPAPKHPDAPEKKEQTEIRKKEPKEVPGQEAYTPEYFFREEQDRLERLLQAEEEGNPVPVKVLKRQRVIVRALEYMVMSQGSTGETKNDENSK